MVMDAIGIKKHETYIRYFNDIVEWGFFRMVQKSTNQYSANIISLISAIPKSGKALDKAFLKHRGKQTQKQPEPIGESNRSIDKQVTIEPETIEPTEIVAIATNIKSDNEIFFENIQTDTESVIDTMNIPDEHRDRARQELFKFWNYWTEKDMRGKERWRKEKTFEVQRRLTTWLMNTKQFTSNQKSNGKRFAD